MGKETAQRSGATTADTSGCLARQQQAEQVVGGAASVICHEAAAQIPHHTDITDAPQLGPNLTNLLEKNLFFVFFTFVTQLEQYEDP